DEIGQLQSGINDLVSVLSLPAMWTGHDASRVAATLLDALVRLLRLDFAYLRAPERIDEPDREWLRSRQDDRAQVRASEVARTLESWLTSDARITTARVPNPIAEGTVSIAVLKLGLHDTVGVLVAGSEREAFPTHIERLLLQVSTNLAAIALQEAARAGEQSRATEALERDVAARTAELSEVNDALRHEVVERARAEQRIRRDEQELRLLVDSVPQLIGTVSPNGTMLHMNRAALDYIGVPLEDGVSAETWRDRFYHPEDREAMRGGVQRALSEGSPHEREARVRRHDGQYRWFLVRHDVLRDDNGIPMRLYASATDIHDRRQAEDRMREENLALREEVDKTSMFEEIVGSSAPLRSVLAHVAKVAPTDSTVLITGETGTGKELVARAIHKRSSRSGRPFISVNCAAMPSSLIASELFGHEKGAFTGASQRRQGRFELADGGTIFLDEVGELPPETQMALLRVLQEREFERVGGSRPIRADVRVIAATNRELEQAVGEKTFRADLFYRLNVFPIEMPPLRDRGEDVPLLVEYFMHRYARRMGKRVHHVSQKTMERLRRYRWPGNIRELQNVIERAIIVSDETALSVDERWLSGAEAVPRAMHAHASNTLVTNEREAIEAALAASRGRVAGTFGAAARLGVPSTTLESKIKTLGIDKRRFKPA
ncbi:MAG: sigma 54-interacting transcriptional regulator, partial [Acidobacteriota bacterium]